MSDSRTSRGGGVEITRTLNVSFILRHRMEERWLGGVVF